MHVTSSPALECCLEPHLNRSTLRKEELDSKVAKHTQRCVVGHELGRDLLGVLVYVQALLQVGVPSLGFLL
jgi:hypothetical protein